MKDKLVLLELIRFVLNDCSQACTHTYTRTYAGAHKHPPIYTQSSQFGIDRIKYFSEITNKLDLLIRETFFS